MSRVNDKFWELFRRFSFLDLSHVTMSSYFKLAVGGLIAAGAAFLMTNQSESLDSAVEEAETNAGEPEEEEEDENIWLEEVTSERSLEWVEEQSRKVKARWKADEGELHDRILKVLNSKDKIPYVSKRGKYYYNLWKDADHVRGLYRRTTLESYRSETPDWETVFDLDAYNEADEGGKNKWVWKGTTLLDEGVGVEPSRVLLNLSKGGADAVVIREFDLVSKEFVDENGFYLSEAKTRASFKDRDTLLVGTEFDGEDSLTDSGYPRIVKEWKRGTPLSEAKTVFEGEKKDVSVGGYYYRDHDSYYEYYSRAITFYTSEHFFRIGSDLVKLLVPEDVEVETFADQLLFSLRSDWGKYTAGSLMSVPFAKFLEEQNNIDVIDDLEEHITVLFEPSDERSLTGNAQTKNCIVLEVLDNVLSKIFVWSYDHETQSFTFEDELQGDEEASIESVSVSAIDRDEGDNLWMYSSSYNIPSTVSIVSALAEQPKEVIKQLPHYYDAEDVNVEQHEAVSLDGTVIRYFMVYKGDKPRNTPTILYGYGGFEISLTPHYGAVTGIGWIEKGFVYCVANIRGGGEYGPKWHQAALKQNRHKAYEDFEAVGQDLIKRGITTAAKLGCYGGSNGGLLVGNMLVRSSSMFGAIVCAVPLLDMKRYNKLLAGASWMGEYGNPDIPEEWEYIKGFSPYHMFSAESAYCPILFTTSTRDDRVHPGHARKMAMRMISNGFENTTHYYENTEGGHAGSSTNDQVAYAKTLEYMFLYTYLDKE
mmetsp:Transcript_15299/g.20101  ORF Transcript_15299/g.20101 Transcript_15299/m.20101 type:complete len:762 (-) Transcript_15299:986-3271(-)